MYQRLLVRSSNILTKIYSHPFNIQLCAGSLPKETFSFYLEQDSLYLLEFAKVLRILSARFRQGSEYSHQFIQLSENMLAEGKSLHLKAAITANSNLLFFSENQNSKREKTKIISDYTAHLLKSATNAPITEAIASCVPCFYVYHQLGKLMAPNCHHDNPYKSWIKSYSSPKFSSSTESIITTFNELIDTVPQRSTEEEKIITSFLKSADFELQFFETALAGRALAERLTTRALGPVII